MKALRKIGIHNENIFNWLNYDFLPDSQGFKFEMHNLNILDDVKLDYDAFQSIFEEVIDEIIIKPPFRDEEWGGFCLDTWDFVNDRVDYSLSNKCELTSKYLNMLINSDIEPQYNGYCECLNWKYFLNLIFDCILSNSAPYSLLFFVPKYDFVFYFHHTSSIGFLYKELNECVLEIIERAKKVNFELKYVNDERVIILQ